MYVGTILAWLGLLTVLFHPIGAVLLFLGGVLLVTAAFTEDDLP